ncbi:hypothetical protein [Desulfobaculum bizertense]|uniref:Uncharacterized protein n=1 Tax=Desulfobaculum bizertense DSM 18034 TaxID=1121442 RepID=A0A1T4W4V1_9BACT|nr:hypothetical protein [Desulfobaculum bizertense]UIJ38672.1 hypothetical protein LWC08_03635 [Desulfobaculum bizertense]SKA72169.1 hypothetical protein SAMN02745702_01610 [Desulfobaculum bizertense DSM 18034]
MKKKLVGVENLDQYICQDTNTLYADGSIILTAGAKDALSKRGITVVYGPKPEGVACGQPAHAAAHAANAPVQDGGEASDASEEDERLILAVASVLKEKYGINDLNTLYTLSTKVVMTVKVNL